MKTLFKSNHTEVLEIDGLEMIKRPVACAILAFDDKGDIIMVEQERGTFGKILEVPAGKVDQGEDPYLTALRELEEETGYRALDAKPLISYFPSVGYSTETINCYWTDNLSPIISKQRLDDGERVTVKKLPFTKVWSMIENGEIKDSKTIMCVYSWLMSKHGF